MSVSESPSRMPADVIPQAGGCQASRASASGPQTQSSDEFIRLCGGEHRDDTRDGIRKIIMCARRVD